MTYGESLAHNEVHQLQVCVLLLCYEVECCWYLCKLCKLNYWLLQFPRVL